MVGAVAEWAKTVFVWMLKVPFVAAIIFAFIIVLNIAISMVTIGMNRGVLSDLFGLVQLWLPFNLNTLLLWFTTASLAYITYRLAITALTFLNRFLNNT